MPFINGTPGDDTLPGTIDHDLINGLQGNDSITADAGDDLVRPGTGDDVADGGTGIDRVSYASAGTDVVTGVTVSLALQGTWQNTIGGGTDYLIGFEHLTGTRYDDVLTGDGGDNWIWGGTDGLGNNGNDIISGGGGNDLIEVGAGTHTLDGGSGTDTLWAFGNASDISSAGVNISLTFQGASHDTEQGFWLLSGFENISGSIHDDILSGDGNDNVLAGDAGHDVLIGGAGADTLYGDGQIGVDTHGIGYSGPITTTADVGVNGNDVLEGGAGDDILNGGGGSDTASYSYSMEGVFVGLGNSGNGSAENASGTEFDQLFSIENVAGSGFNDQLLGNDSDNVLIGADGHDLLFGRGGSDTLIGGNGDDFLRGSDGADWLDGGSGWDRVSSFVPAPTSGISFDLNIQGVAQDTGQGMDTLVDIEHASGTVLNDTLTGNGGDNWLWDGADGDAAVASSGNDVINAGGGNDLVEVGAGDDTLDGGLGNDTWSLLGGQSEISSAGVTVSLALQGAAQNTEQGMMTATGFENLSGSLHHDELIGDANANRLDGDQGHDRLVGGDGDDTLYGDGRTHVDNHGTGGSGAITSWADSTVLDPGYEGGSDWLEGGLGNDTLDGGAGIDWASYVNATGFVNVTIGNVSGSAFGADGTDTLRNIENIVGSAYDDSIFGNSGDNWLDGYAGNDSLRGRDGNDTVFGNDGNDFLNGGAGDDVVDGGNGFDRATYYTGATAGVTVDLNLQGVAQNTGQGMDTLVSIENVSGTAFGDTLTGDGGDNWLWGSPATLADLSISPDNNDTLDGGGGNDLLTVGIGNHSLTGGTGTDTVSFTENGNPEPALTISLELQGIAQATGAGSWTLNGIENLSGGIADDHLTGDGNDNVLAGDQGHDNLVGGAGNDTLYGDGRIAIDYAGGPGTSGPIATFADGAAVDPAFVNGNDILDGGAGDDTLNGGGGNDTASFASATEGVSVFLNALGNGSAFQDGSGEVDALFSIENVTGSAFNDTVVGNAQDNVIDGGDGDDFLQGRQGNDTLTGGDGDDLFRAGTGDDVVAGGAGFDRVSHYGPDVTGGVTVSLLLQGVAQDTGQGMDTLTGIEALSGTRFDDTLIGDHNDNWLVAADGADTLIGNGGNDLLAVSDGELGSATGNHVMDGGTGSDTAGFAGVVIDGTGIAVSLELQGAAQDSGHGMLTLSNFENLSGSQHDDALTGDSSDNSLSGHAGNDTLIGGAGDDSLYGDGAFLADFSDNGGLSGPLTFFSDVTAFDPFLVDGDDTLEGGAGNDALDGGGGTDTASYAGNSGPVEVSLQAGFADEYAADGVTYLSTDTLVNIENVTGSAHDDFIVGDGNANMLSGGEGNDQLRGLGGDDTLNGDGGHDFIRGGDGNDRVDGGEGDDYLAGDAGDDYLDGGNGFDRVSYAVGATAGVTVSLAIATAQATGQGTDTLVNVEHLTGTTFSDNLTGNSGDNWIWGGSDGSGVTGNDVINAGDGNDLVEVGTGNHMLSGGNGNDTLSLFGNSSDISAAGITFDLTLQGAAQNTEQGMMNASGFENVSGSIHADSITGDAGANILLGDLGDDTLRGGDGDDHLYGDGRMLVDSHGLGRSGPIALFGDVLDLDPSLAPGNDILLGGRGDDWLYGGRGNDMLTGNQGVDRFVIEASSGNDQVTDFAANVDKILFDASSGVDDFSDLTLTKVGSNTVITWGTGDSLTIAGVKPNQLDSGDFEFGPSAAASMAIPDTGKSSLEDDRAFGMDIYTGPHGAIAIAISDAMII